MRIRRGPAAGNRLSGNRLSGGGAENRPRGGCLFPSDRCDGPGLPLPEDARTHAPPSRRQQRWTLVLRQGLVFGLARRMVAGGIVADRSAIRRLVRGANHDYQAGRPPFLGLTKH